MKRLVMNKKGAIEWSTLLPLFIGLAVVGIIVYFWFNLGEAGEDITGALPDAIAAQSQTCGSVYAQIENTAGWCNPSKIDDKEYMNCKYIKDKYNPTLGEDFNPVCVTPEKTFCEQLKNEQGEKYAVGKEYDPAKIYVNGKTCVYWDAN